MGKKFLIIILLLLCVSFSFSTVYAARPDFEQSQVDDGSENNSSVDNDCVGGIKTACGLPYGLVLMINDIYNLLKIAVPIVLIIMGMIDLLKAVASQKEDEIKKGWQMVIKRTIAGILVFFVFFIVQLVIDLLPSKAKNDAVTDCVKCIFTNTEKCETDCITTGANTDN